MIRNLRYVSSVTLTALIIAAGLNDAGAQTRKKKNQPAAATVAPPAPAAAAGSKPGVKPYKEVITAKAVTDNGLFKVHRLDSKYYYEIPDSLFDREMLVVTRYAKTPTQDRTYGGEELNEQVWKWQKRDKQVFIRVPSYRNVAAKGTDMYESVQNSNLDAVLASFDIKA
ncbi:MAG TPA: DUF5118 domain-containing protein, partial [Daejeonella sp.]|nr:DUF5118 domain-containing protein [Daejeonella sp.]